MERKDQCKVDRSEEDVEDNVGVIAEDFEKEMRIKSGTNFFPKKC